MKPKSRELLFVPLGGAGEIGMNLNLYGCDGAWLMADLGLTFADETLPGIDLVLPDPVFAESIRDDLAGLVLTHAHEDHMGAVPYLWPRLKCPVYATPFTATLLRAKLSEAGLLDAVPLHVLEIGESVQVGPFRVRYLRMTHSIPEPAALAIETPAGLVLHSGDWKIDPDPLIAAPTDIAALRACGEQGVLALVCDSTNAMTGGHSGSEASLFEDLSRVVSRRAGRVAITTFASNLARIQTVARVAEAQGRRVAVVGRSLWRTIEAARKCGYLGDVPQFLTERDVRRLARDEVLLLCTGCQGEPRGAMWRIASGDHPHVGLDEGDLVIFSSKMIPGNERVLGRLHNRLLEDGIDVITEKDAHVHVSGHPCREELLELYGWVRPEILVPVHGEVRHMRAQAELGRSAGIPRVVTVRNGQVLRLAPGDVEIVGEVPTGRLALDGTALEPPDGQALQERRRLMYNGWVSVTLIMAREKNAVLDVSVLARGVPGGAADLERVVGDAVLSAFEGLPAKVRGDDAVVGEKLRIAARRRVEAQCGKRPVVDVRIRRIATREKTMTKDGKEAMA